MTAVSLPQESAARHLWQTAVNSGAYFASDAIARAVSLGLVLAYTRIFSPQNYGTLALATTVTTLLTPVIGLSVTASLTRLYFEARDEQERSRLYGSMLAFLLVVPTIGMLILELLGDMGYLDMFAAAPWNPYLRLAAWTGYALLFVDIPVAIAIAERRSRLVFALGALNALLLLGASLFFVVVLDQGVAGVLRGSLLAATVMAVVSIVLTRRAAGNRLGFSRVLLFQALAFGIPLVPHAIAQWLLQVSDRLLLTHYVAPDAVGVYYLGYSVAAVAGLGALGVAKAIGPVVTTDLKAGTDVRVIRLGTYAFTVLTWFCLLLASVGATVLAFLVPARFDGAIDIVPIVCLAYIAFGAYTIVAQGIWFSMRTWLVPVVTLAAAAVNIGLNLIFIPRFGITGAAWDTVAGFTALAVFQGFWAHRLHPIRWDYARCLLVVVAAVATYFITSRVWIGASEKALALELLGAFVVFPVLLSLSGFVTPRELGWLRAHVPHALRPLLVVVRSGHERSSADAGDASAKTRRPPPARLRLATLAPIVVFVAATTHWMSWQEPIRLQFAADVDDYVRIARAAPHFTWPQITGHLSMWPVHYVVGVLAKATHIPLHVMYYVCAFAVLATIVLLVDQILVHLRVGLPVYAIAMAALLLDPYVFRYLALAPGMINDGVFIAGACLAVWALLDDRLGWLCAGLTIAALGRGLSVPPLLLAVGLWMVLLPRPGRPFIARRIGQAFGVLAVPTAAFAVAYAIGKTTPGHAPALKDCCSVTQLTIWGDISELPGSAGSFALHLYRIVLGLAMPLSVLAAAGLLVVRAGVRHMPTAFWGALLVTGAMVAQPLLVSSHWNAGAEPRLTSLAIGPAVAAVAILLQTLVDQAGLRFGRGELAAILALFAVASLNHRFANVGPRTAAQFAALELICIIAVVGLLAGRRFRRGSRDSEPASP
jgi:O-antigen/teichoic acid export membrane protein